MKKLVALAALAFALAVGTNPQLAYADPGGGCSGSGCATEEPTVTMPPQGSCETSNCNATPEPAPVQVAYPCDGANCATPEPAPVQVAAPCDGPNCATPEPAPTQVAGPCDGPNCATPDGDRPARATASLSPGGAALGKAVRAVKERIRQQRTGCASQAC